jgi:catechol 2,3-dioxygenase-like lactoylglutathione lyase family enzyme
VSFSGSRSESNHLYAPGFPYLVRTVSIRRVVPNLASDDLAATRDFYVEVLGFDVVMDMGWIVTVVSPSNPTAQISFAGDGIRPSSDAPLLTIEVADVDGVHQAALDRDLDVVLSLRDEEWGVRRFFLRDPDGRVINVMSHPAASG